MTWSLQLEQYNISKLFENKISSPNCNDGFEFTIKEIHKETIH